MYVLGVGGDRFGPWMYVRQGSDGPPDPGTKLIALIPCADKEESAARLSGHLDIVIRPHQWAVSAMPPAGHWPISADEPTHCREAARCYRSIEPSNRPTH
jgi:hypothetical protein